MKIQLLSVGRPRDPLACALHDRYEERIRRFGIAYSTSWVPEVPAGGRFSDDHAREREAGTLIERLDTRGTVIALDRAGTMHDSRALAGLLERWATPRAHLVLGGPLGLHRKLLERADSVWSLSALTLPHELARALVAEQVYRGLTLLRHVPYHK